MATQLVLEEVDEEAEGALHRVAQRQCHRCGWVGAPEPAGEDGRMPILEAGVLHNPGEAAAGRNAGIVPHHQLGRICIPRVKQDLALVGQADARVEGEIVGEGIRATLAEAWNEESGAAQRVRAVPEEVTRRRSHVHERGEAPAEDHGCSE